GPPRACSNALIALRSCLALDTKLSGGHCLTHIGREGGARKATSTIPIVFLVHADPLATGHVASLARPGGNITGLSLQLTEIYRKGFDILISTVPAAKRIAVLYNPDTPSHIPGLHALEEPARPRL